MNIKVGTIGDYCFYKNVKIVEIKEKTIVMQDSSGGKKEFYKSLIEKYFEPKDMINGKTIL